MAIGGERLQCKIKHNFKYNKHKWKFIAKEQGEGFGGWKITKGRQQGQETLAKLTQQDSY